MTVLVIHTPCDQRQVRLAPELIDELASPYSFAGKVARQPVLTQLTPCRPVDVIPKCPRGFAPHLFRRVKLGHLEDPHEVLGLPKRGEGVQSCGASSGVVVVKERDYPIMATGVAELLCGCGGGTGDEWGRISEKATDHGASVVASPVIANGCYRRTSTKLVRVSGLGDQQVQAGLIVAPPNGSESDKALRRLPEHLGESLKRGRDRDGLAVP